VPLSLGSPPSASVECLERIEPGAGPPALPARQPWGTVRASRPTRVIEPPLTIVLHRFVRPGPGRRSDSAAAPNTGFRPSAGRTMCARRGPAARRDPIWSVRGRRVAFWQHLRRAVRNLFASKRREGPGACTNALVRWNSCRGPREEQSGSRRPEGVIRENQTWLAGCCSDRRHADGSMQCGLTAVADRHSSEAGRGSESGCFPRDQSGRLTGCESCSLARRQSGCVACARPGRESGGVSFAGCQPRRFSGSRRAARCERANRRVSRIFRGSRGRASQCPGPEPAARSARDSPARGRTVRPARLHVRR
jgi:hypothetical protein